MSSRLIKLSWGAAPVWLNLFFRRSHKPLIVHTAHQFQDEQEECGCRRSEKYNESQKILTRTKENRSFLKGRQQ